MAIGAVLSFALGLALAPQAPAGLVQGRVTDATNLPLPGATVMVKGSEAFAVTDDRGEFDLSAPAGSRLLISLPGFTPREIVAAAAGPLAITLHIANVQTVVTVRAPNPAPPVESRFALSPLDVVRTPGAQADLMRALESMPGVATIDEGAGLFVRGGDVSEVLVLLDGVVVSHPYRYETPTGGFRGAVDPFLTQGASFATGGFSAPYGNVMSGVIDLAGLGRPKTGRMTMSAGLAGVALSGALPIGASGGMRVAANRTTPALLFAVNHSPRDYDRLPGGWDASGGAYYDSPSLGSFRVMAIAQRDHVGVEIERDAFAGFLHSGTEHELVAARWERGLAGPWRATASLGTDIYANRTDAGVFKLDTSDRRHSGRLEITGNTSGWMLRTGADADLARGPSPEKCREPAAISAASPASPGSAPRPVTVTAGSTPAPRARSDDSRRILARAPTISIADTSGRPTRASPCEWICRRATTCASPGASTTRRRARATSTASAARRRCTRWPPRITSPATSWERWASGRSCGSRRMRSATATCRCRATPAASPPAATDRQTGSTCSRAGSGRA